MGWEEREREGGKGGEGWLPKLVTSDAVRKTQNNSDTRVGAFSHPCDGPGPPGADTTATPGASCLALLKSQSVAFGSRVSDGHYSCVPARRKGEETREGMLPLFKGLTQTLYTSVPLPSY